ncbi:MAG: carboxypeptidase-like regulatory domain-containing protein [Chloroflexi bacterium]|nr:carboxypeptidase-like regulatory domain-containing protein [Chloroflexota bacterium]MBU1746808.1 carboxypeptidase-like regulatory domain-containing protein [Chloroflexota bacterium]MBU1877906.1 carboxypeptidase-like regulatory domain-containing protein [Chloroflexota bacterium]
MNKIVWAGGCLLVAILLAGTVLAQEGVRFRGQAITEPLGPNDAPSYAVQGRVTSAEGPGLGGITVRIFTDGWEGAVTGTSGDGYYEFAGLSAGNYYVTLLGVEADTVISGRVDGQTRVVVNFVRSPTQTPTPTHTTTPSGPTRTPSPVPNTPTPIPATLPTIMFIRTATPLPAGTPEPSGRSSILDLFNISLDWQPPDLRPLGNAFCLGGFCFVGCLVFVVVMGIAQALLRPGAPLSAHKPPADLEDPRNRRQRRS